MTELPKVVSNDYITHRGRPSKPWPLELFDGRTRLLPDDYIIEELGYSNRASFMTGWHYTCEQRQLRGRCTRHPDGVAIRAEQK